MNRARVLSMTVLAATLYGTACSDGGGVVVDASADRSSPLDGADAADATNDHAPMPDAPTPDAPDDHAPMPDAPTPDVTDDHAAMPDAPTPDAPTSDAPDDHAPTPDAPTPDAGAIAEWAVLVHDDSNDDIYAIATFPDGSSIVSGSILQPGTLAGAPTTPGGFLMRLNADGTPAWMQIGREPSVKNLVALADGTFVAAGFSQGLSVVFGRGEPNETTLPGTASGPDFYLARYKGDGTLVWANRAAVNAPWQVSKIDAAADGSVFVTGSFTTRITFGAGTPQATELVAVNVYGWCTARYTKDGALVWVKEIVGRAPTYLELKALPDGSTLVAGNMEWPLTFGPGEARETTLTNPDHDLFVARYAPDGTLAWAKGMQAPDLSSFLEMWRFSLRPDGSFYLGGAVHGSVTFGAGGPSIASTGDHAGFVAQGRADGSIAWARAISGDSATTVVQVTALTALSNGDAVAVATVHSAATLTIGTTAAMPFASLGDPDQLLVRFSSTGDFLSSTQIGGPAADFIQALAPSGDAVIAGLAFGSLDPGPLTLPGVSSSVTLRPGTARSLTYAGQYYDALVGRIVP